jgi:hypothetical protein
LEQFNDYVIIDEVQRMLEIFHGRSSTNSGMTGRFYIAQIRHRH